eukprot:TRINITY_DN11819_c0_g1_i2.p1 TRINITY_DN11819_c0_g1~~TRINITY_DN11819_c0_g1_i2.p1  ORF type:complete len:648 (+),score=126.97 TRINITY_DN11819_c0_g1_i2:167-2110(+)
MPAGDKVHTYGDWTAWCLSNPQAVSLLSGAFAGTASETLLFPLDCLKTRLQSRRGFYQSGGFRGLYRGVGTAICAAAPASAMFFSTYEATKRCLCPYVHGNSVVGHCGVGLIASILGELAAGVYRVPMDLVKQRQQAGHGQTIADIFQGVRSTKSSVFLASFQASFSRDIMHSSLQFPLYECLKLAVARWSCGGDQRLMPTWHAACCGSVAGVVSAVLTTPLDLLRTRLNLRGCFPTDEYLARSESPLTATGLMKEEIARVYSQQGVLGFFAGGACRAAWMGLGGFIFLGSFELAKKNILGGCGDCAASVASQASSASDDAGDKLSLTSAVVVAEQTTPINSRCAPHGAVTDEVSTRRLLGPEPPAFVSMLAGLLAGMTVDIPLHPLDTIKTRMQSPGGLAGSGGFARPWSGLSAVLLVSVPGSAVFFVVYDNARHGLERRAPVALQGDNFAMGRDAVAASVADVAACSVRVPCEVLKQRMQALGPSGSPQPTFLRTVGRVRAEGLRGFYAGFAATALREVPFALIQMPLFEELKLTHPWAAEANQNADCTRKGLVAMHSGALAGCFAGVVTTPLDAAKTRIMLTVNRADRRGLFETMLAIRQEAGLRGLFRGVVPRAAHCGLGGALWLGAFEWSKLLLWSANSVPC